MGGDGTNHADLGQARAARIVAAMTRFLDRLRHGPALTGPTFAEPGLSASELCGVGGDRRGGWLRNGTYRAVIVACLILLTTLLHAFVAPSDLKEHILLREAYYFPLLLAALWFGVRGGLLALLGVIVLYLPLLLFSSQGFSINRFDGIVGIVLYFFIVLVVGLLRDREVAIRERLARAQYLSTLGQAVSGIAHDMKNPLMVIGGFTELVRDKLPPDTREQEHLAIVVSQVRRLEAMVRDMLVFAKPLTPDRHPARLEDILAEVEILAREEADKNKISLVFQTDKCFPIEVDARRLEQALTNLVTNAIQASPPGATVTVRAYQRSGQSLIDVIDQGPGVPRDKKKEIFTAFYTSKREGTGLGLPIVQKIVEAHGGRIEVLDNPDRGATFRVVLPKP